MVRSQGVDILPTSLYCFRIPDGYPLASAAPLLCAGITVYNPMMRHKMNQPGKSLGVIGLGGLGHMAVKFGKAFGLKVTVLSTSISKKEEALCVLGADNFVITSDQEQMKALHKSLDFIIDTASGDHPFDPYMSLLKTAGVFVLVGFPSEVKHHPASLIIGMKTISGSVTGGTRVTQEMLDFCAANKIYPKIEVIPIQYVNEALERMIKNDVKYRFVIDIDSSLNSESVKDDCLAWAARDPSGVLSPYKFSRRALGKDDVSLKITHCGICYADAVMSKNKYGDSRYPLVPGHEIAGIVKEVGSCVSNFKVGDHVGVGTYVNSCRECEHCNDRDEISCEKGAIFTFNGIDTDGSITKGGYSSHIVVHETYCFRIPDGYPLASAALCSALHKSLDFIIDTASGDHPFDPYMSLLKTAGVFVLVGHEIAGIVKEVGSCVSNFKVGDHVGVGTYVNSCRECEHLQCEKGAIFTFNGIDTDGSITKGGYSSHIVVHETYVRIPDGYPLASAAPLLCAGITVYNPMMRHKMNQPGKSLGVIGLGGLGHMAVKFGKAFGLKVTVLSTSISKKEEALCVLGADNFVITSDQEQMKALHKSLDFIIDTASGDHPFDPYMSLLKTAGVFVLVGFPSEVKFHPASLIFGMKTVSGSVTGGTRVTQEMLDFCAANKIYPKIEVIPIQYVNEALERMIKNDVKYRFVIDIESSLKLLDFMINTVSGNHRFDPDILLVFLFFLGSQVKSETALQKLILAIFCSRIHPKIEVTPIQNDLSMVNHLWKFPMFYHQPSLFLHQIDLVNKNGQIDLFRNDNL
uniref:mannitol dehydrogenase n=1 Tax=Salix viminalis TaxID=40686 RepID=A0A6N2MV32_SALVM